MAIFQRPDEPLRKIELFAGTGGGILAGILLGHETICAVEQNPYAAAVLLARQNDGTFPPSPIWDDVCTFDGYRWRGRADIVCGGFPCQDISPAGKGAGLDGEKSGLWSQMLRIIGEVRPRFAYIENSSMLVIRGLDRVLCDLAALGYDAKWGVISAEDCGAPHERARIWILAEMADTQGQRCGEAREFQYARPAQRPTGSSAEMADTDGSRSAGRRLPLRTDSQSKESYSSCTWWRFDPAEQAESGMGRMADGVAHWSHRIRAIGNGQVPVVAATAFRLLGGDVT